jgi:hypothetical protein
MQVRVAAELDKKKLLRFCAPRTPCHSLWVEIKGILQRNDKRGAKKYVYAWGFAHGVKWAIMVLAAENREIQQLLEAKAASMGVILKKRAKLDVLD